MKTLFLILIASVFSILSCSAIECDCGQANERLQRKKEAELREAIRRVTREYELKLEAELQEAIRQVTREYELKLEAELREAIRRVTWKHELKLEDERKKEADKLRATRQGKEEVMIDPGDTFFKAWLLCRRVSKQPHAERLANLQAAKGLLNGIRVSAPDWKPDIVRARLRSIQAEIDKLKNQANHQI